MGIKTAQRRRRLRHMWKKTAQIDPFSDGIIHIREKAYVDKDGPDRPLLIWHITLKGEFVWYMWIKTPRVDPFSDGTIHSRENTSSTYVDKDGPDRRLLV